jgi:hypothetical protein
MNLGKYLPVVQVVSVAAPVVMLQKGTFEHQWFVAVQACFDQPGEP